MMSLLVSALPVYWKNFDISVLFLNLVLISIAGMEGQVNILDCHVSELDIYRRGYPMLSRRAVGIPCNDGNGYKF
ncbi:MAG: hypothetical protein LBE56_12715 [Tannerella sp.]|nr:hypothetical protein [Tannerella sp.]